MLIRPRGPSLTRGRENHRNTGDNVDAYSHPFKREKHTTKSSSPSLFLQQQGSLVQNHAKAVCCVLACLAIVIVIIIIIIAVVLRSQQGGTYMHHSSMREGMHEYNDDSNFGIFAMQSDRQWDSSELERRTRVFHGRQSLQKETAADEAAERPKGGDVLISFIVPCAQCCVESSTHGDDRNYRTVFSLIREQILLRYVELEFEVVVMGIEGSLHGSTFRNDMLLYQYAALKAAAGRYLYFMPVCTPTNVMQIHQLDLSPLFDSSQMDPWLVMSGITVGHNGTVENGGIIFKRSMSKINGKEAIWKSKKGPMRPHVLPSVNYHGMPESALLSRLGRVIGTPGDRAVSSAVDAAVIDHMVIPRKLFLSLDGFDTQHYQTIELSSIDLCLRAVKSHQGTGFKNPIILYPGLRISQAGHQGLLALKQENFVRRSERFHWFTIWNSFLLDHFILAKISPNLHDTNIIYVSPLCTPSGFADEGITTAMHLENHANLLVNDFVGSWKPDRVTNAAERPRAVLDMLNRLNNWNVAIMHDRTLFNILLVSWTPNIIAHLGDQITRADYKIGRYMFETDRFPDEWVADIMKMDELWLPAGLVRDVFKSHLQRSVPRGSKIPELFVIPEPIDVNLFNPDTVVPLSNEYGVFVDIDKDTRFKFLSVFEWSARKNWKGLLLAYFQEFSKRDNVALYIKTQVPGDAKVDQMDHSLYLATSIREAQLEASSIGGRTVKDMPEVIVYHRLLHLDRMPSLYKSVDAYVMASHGEGCGRPYMEAMAMQLPVIGTGWGGNVEFMNSDNSFLIEYDLQSITHHKLYSFYLGHKWAVPRVAHLRKLMRHVMTDRQDAQEKAVNARRYIVSNNNPARISQLMLERFEDIRRKRRANRVNV